MTSLPTQENNELLIHLWKEARIVINHFDRMMDDLRVRTLTIFGTVTSISAAVHYSFHEIQLYGLRISALIEIVFIVLLSPICIQNVFYHHWLYKAINLALNIEDYLYDSLQERFSKDKIFITSSLTGLLEPRALGFWSSMLRSRLAWLDFFVYMLILVISVVLCYIFLVT